MKIYKIKKHNCHLYFDEHARISIDESKQWNMQVDLQDLLQYKNDSSNKSITVNLFAYKYLTNNCELIKV